MKKFFKFSALTAMMGLVMATATVTTSCSDDDDDNTPSATDTTFTISMGGTGSSAGSFLSIKNCEVYNTTTVRNFANDVEIVFNGFDFDSSERSIYALVSENGNSAVIKSTGAMSWSFETSTGFKGSLTLNDVPGDVSATYVVTVIRRTK